MTAYDVSAEDDTGATTNLNKGKAARATDYEDKGSDKTDPPKKFDEKTIESPVSKYNKNTDKANNICQYIMYICSGDVKST